MTSRQIIRAVLTFQKPPRIGMALPEPYLNDMVFGRRKGCADRQLQPEGGQVRRWQDEWGMVWASLTAFDRGQVVEPAISDWSRLDDYVPPDLGRPEDYADCAKTFAADGRRFRIGSLPGFTFNVARGIRRLDNYLCDLALEPEAVMRLNAVVRRELLNGIDRLAEAGADAIMFTEDWGTQDRLMISPQMWREVFKPEFQALAGRAHERGLFVIMHSCGKMTAIIEDLLGCGIDCLQFDQPRLHGIEELSDRFGGRVAFWCPVDIQTTLQTRQAERIRGEARLLVEKLGGFDGGFIAGYYADNQSIGLGREVQDIACKAFMEYGVYG